MGYGMHVATPPSITNLIPALDWEQVWAPYDMPTYQAVLAHIRPTDVVLEIGAGDLRLARLLAQQARWVYAVEQNRQVLPNMAKTAVPANLRVFCADARTFPIPADVTVAVLLMRHCRHFAHYANRLAACGCGRLITNARWRMNVEVIDLQTTRQSFTAVSLGWYACWCGTVGFVSGLAEHLTPDIEAHIHEVAFCPTCTEIL